MHYGWDLHEWDALPWWQQRMYLEGLAELTGSEARTGMPDAGPARVDYPDGPQAGTRDTDDGWSTTPLGVGTGGPPPAQLPPTPGWLADALGKSPPDGHDGDAAAA